MEGVAAHYWLDGKCIVKGDWLLSKDSIEVIRTPGYPLFVAIFQTVFGSYALVAITLCQQVMVFATALITAGICRRVSGSRWGGILGLILGLVCVSQNGVALYLLSDTLFCLLLTIAVAMLVAWQQRPTALAAAAIGLFFGLATLVRPIAQLAVVPVLAAMVLSLSRRGVAAVAPARGMFAGHGKAVLAPWYARNYCYTGQCFLTKAGGLVLWQSLFKGSHEDRLNPPCRLPKRRTPRPCSPAWKG